jgi:hypothetical protein
MSLLTSSAIDTINLAALMNANSNAFAIKNFSVILINFLIIFFVFYHHIPHTNEDMWGSGCDICTGANVICTGANYSA